MNLIDINNLSLGYDGKKVLNNLSFKVDENDFICIVGPNGSGKTTLIKGLLGIIKPMKGTIKYNNVSKNSIGYLSQDTKIDKNFPASVSEIVLSGCLNHLGLKPFYSKKDKEECLSNLKILKIENLKNKNYCDLSGGQRQKVLLARSLCASNKLLILDEPSNNLDYNSKKELYNLAYLLNKNNNITIIMITHDLDHNNLIGNKVLSLEPMNYFFGTKEEYMEVINND